MTSFRYDEPGDPGTLRSDDLGESTADKLSPDRKKPRSASQDKTKERTFQGALVYLETVKARLTGTGQLDKYNRFVEAMKDYKSNKLNIQGLKTEVKLLFAENSELITGFNRFLPAGEEFELDEANNCDAAMTLIMLRSTA